MVWYAAFVPYPPTNSLCRGRRGRRRSGGAAFAGAENGEERERQRETQIETERDTETKTETETETETEIDLTFKSRFMRPKKSSTLSGLALIASAEENSSRVVPTRRTMHGRIYLKWVYKGVVGIHIYIVLFLECWGLGFSVWRGGFIEC